MANLTEIIDNIALTVEAKKDDFVTIKYEYPKEQIYQSVDWAMPEKIYPWTSYEIKYSASDSMGNLYANYYSKPLSTLIQEEKMPTAILSEKDVPSQEILNLMPGSVPEDWHKHENPCASYPGGWVYKDSKVHQSSHVMEDCVVYGSSVIETGAVLRGGKIFSSVVGPHSVIKNSVILSEAAVGKGCNIYGNSKIFGKIGNNCVISGKTIIQKGVIISDGTSLSSTPMELRTQKTKGLVALSKHNFLIPENSLYQIEWLKTNEELQELVNKFVRPCPVTPRHGFVDSRPLKTLEDARNLIEETRAADEKAEIIAMPFVDACHSGVWTKGLLSVGKSNDGATTGRDSIRIPVIGYPEMSRGIDWTRLLEDAGITESPYLEILWEKHDKKHNINDKLKKTSSVQTSTKFRPTYVQLRNGPVLPETVNFIPKKITVTNVVEANGDLLAWEKLVKELPEGTVIYHPGGSLASHYAIHAYLSNIPILISRKPIIGESLEPDTDEQAPDIVAMKRGFMLGCKMNISLQNAAYVMMAGCHHTTKWLGKCDLLLGLSMGCAYRLIVAAALGEFRRYGSTVLNDGSSIGEREDEYSTWFPRSFYGVTRKKYITAMESFDKDHWRTCSVGGPKWFLLSRYAALIFNSLVDNDYKSALEALNKGVNSVHNSGWTFNKFISESEMTYTADNPIHSILPIAPLLYEAIEKGGVGLEKRFVPQRKFKLEEINTETYLEEQRKKWNEKRAEQAKTLLNSTSTKVCCTKECCGNPDCEECHPAVVQPVCDCGSHHCSVCYPDGCSCECSNCCDSGCGNCCDCKDHDCLNCNPGGCDCEHTECHDCGDSDCENCNPEVETETE